MLAAPDYRVLFESAPGLYLVLTPELRITAVSNAYLQATMTGRDAILGRGIFEVFPDNPGDPAADGVSTLRASLERVLSTGRPDAMAVQKYDIRRPDSEGGGFEVRYWSPVNTPVVRDGEVVYIIHRVEDVTEFIRLKQQEQLQEERAAELRTRTGQMEAEIYRRAQELAATNRQLRETSAAQASLYDQIALLMAQADDELPSEGGGVSPVSPEEMLARVGDLIAGHKSLEERLRQAHKMQAIGRLAGGIAHDFNNLLTVISGYANLLASRLPARAGRIEAERIEDAAARAAALTSQLLAFSRKQFLERRLLDLGDVIRGMEALLASLIGEGIQLTVDAPSGLGTVLTDPSQMEQVIMNLAVNARDAMPAGGKLAIAIGSLTIHSATEPPHLMPGAHIRLTVRDTGQGMDAKTMSRIFEPFYTTKGPGKGTGLGLATVYGIVEQSGGKVTVESQVGVGTAFTVYLPAVSAEAAARETTEPEAPVRRTRASILLAEDNAAVREFVRRVLADAGHQVETAGDGARALALLEKRAESVDLLITDVVMSNASGPDLVKGVRQRFPALPVLYVSGYDQELLDRDAFDPHTAFLRKPFTAESLLAAAGKLLGAVEAL